MENKTIAAIATPLGPGGIGIVRVSGPDALPILKRLFVRFNKQGAIRRQMQRSSPHQFTSHFFYYGHIADPTTKNIIDEVLVVYMKGPKSFTREDVIEIHSHAGFVLLDRMLSAVLDAGASLANPGEFTKRAFLNGRIDLSQAEAVIDLINAPCETAVQIAGAQIRGGLRERVGEIKSTIMKLRAQCEAVIEFSEEIEDEASRSDFKKALNGKVLPEIALLIQRQKEAAIYRDGIALAIAGVPNVGKSSLLNKLVENEVAIVSEVPGTTRDIVREYFSINGVPIVVCDTAGIHDTEDPVESIGVQKARTNIQYADIVLMVLEAHRAINDKEETLLSEIHQKKTIVVINKNDLADEGVIVDIYEKLSTRPIIRVSAKFGDGLDELKRLIFQHVVKGNGGLLEEGATTNLRHRKIFEKAQKQLKKCLAAIDTNEPLEFVSVLLDNTLDILNDISGTRGQQDLYDHIFDQFCIGK